MTSHLTFCDNIHVLSPVDNIENEKSRQAKYQNGCNDHDEEAGTLVLRAVVPHKAMDRSPVCERGGPSAVVGGGSTSLIFNPKEAGLLIAHLH